MEDQHQPDLEVGSASSAERQVEPSVVFDVGQLTVVQVARLYEGIIPEWSLNDPSTYEQRQMTEQLDRDLVHFVVANPEQGVRLLESLLSHPNTEVRATVGLTIRRCLVGSIRAAGGEDPDNLEELAEVYAMALLDEDAGEWAADGLRDAAHEDHIDARFLVPIARWTADLARVRLRSLQSPGSYADETEEL